MASSVEVAQAGERIDVVLATRHDDHAVTGNTARRPSDLPVRAQGADSVALAPLMEWLEVGFGLALLRRTGQGDPGVPGWSIAPHEALELLDLCARPMDETSLAARRSAADGALIVSRTTLPGPLAEVAEAFSLTELELRLLCLVLAPELDGRYATVIGVLQDDLTRRRPGLTLLAELMAESEVGAWDLRRAIFASHSVSSEGLVHPVGPEALPIEVGLAPSEAVVAHLLAPSIDRAVAASDAVLQGPIPSSDMPLSSVETQLARWLERRIATSSATIQLVGGGPSKAWFNRLAASIGLPLVVGDLGEVEPGVQQVEAVSDWGVLSRLAEAGLMVLGIDGLGPVERRRVGARLLELARGLRLVVTDGERSFDWSWRGSALQLRAPIVSIVQRAAWWSRAANRNGLALGPEDVQRLAATAPIDPERIDRSVAVAASQAASANESVVALVQRAARELEPTPLPQGVRRLVPTYRWDDIVLSPQRKELLQAIPLARASGRPSPGGVGLRRPDAIRARRRRLVQRSERHRQDDGGADHRRRARGRPPQVDLSKTISKYIGETEKNLDSIFDAAEATGSVLLFDEADAIFGKRTEIKDAHDRHANVEVAYLLQRMESFRGLAVLTTNFKQNIDDAFVRRLRFVVEFALPDAAERHRIWRKAFPKGAPLARDVDVARLAGGLQIPGGSIQNIALHAAFLAAGDGGPIDAAHLLAATRRELVKIGMLTAERSLDELAATS